MLGCAQKIVSPGSCLKVPFIEVLLFVFSYLIFTTFTDLLSICILLKISAVPLLSISCFCTSDFRISVKPDNRNCKLSAKSHKPCWKDIIIYAMYHNYVFWLARCLNYLELDEYSLVFVSFISHEYKNSKTTFYVLLFYILLYLYAKLLFNY